MSAVELVKPKINIKNLKTPENRHDQFDLSIFLTKDVNEHIVNQIKKEKNFDNQFMIASFALIYPDEFNVIKNKPSSKHHKSIYPQLLWNMKSKVYSSYVDYVHGNFSKLPGTIAGDFMQSLSCIKIAYPEWFDVVLKDNDFPLLENNAENLLSRMSRDVLEDDSRIFNFMSGTKICFPEHEFSLGILSKYKKTKEQLFKNLKDRNYEYYWQIENIINSLYSLRILEGNDSNNLIKSKIPNLFNYIITKQISNSPVSILKDLYKIASIYSDEVILGNNGLSLVKHKVSNITSNPPPLERSFT